MLPSVLANFESVISKPRLDSYRGYFQARTLDEAIGLYMWNTELSASFSTLISLFEVALRNQVHRAMSLHYSNGASASIHWYDRIYGSLKPATKSKIEEVRHEWVGRTRRLRNPQPSADEIVSRVSFGFWPGILSTIDRRVNYADKIYPAIFPHHALSATPTDWLDHGNRTAALAFIYELNTFRNRLAHHEPLWKFAALHDQAGRLTHPSTTTLQGSIARFNRLLSLIDAALQAMTPSFQADLIESSWSKRIKYLLSNRGVLRYRMLNHCPTPTMIEPRDLQRNFHLVVRKNQPVYVRLAGSRGLFLPD